MAKGSKPRSKGKSASTNKKPISTASAAKGKMTQNCNKTQTSVSRLQADIESEASGPPENLKPSEEALEASGISVAPPKHQTNAEATIRAQPPRRVSARIHRSEVREDMSGKDKGIGGDRVVDEAGNRGDRGVEEAGGDGAVGKVSVGKLEEDKGIGGDRVVDEAGNRGDGGAGEAGEVEEVEEVEDAGE
ncbi:hypothetical protein H0H92_014961, partial [Tricholoma furcatifolium]